ncbi:hypothetical protein CFIMG_000161RA, partial [Ceratocystis fimbriata CBS 114723]
MQPISDPVSPRVRPIHPLPKRRLRERLSDEVAESIEYPPSSPATPTPIFHYPAYNPELGYVLKSELFPSGSGSGSGSGSPSAHSPSPDPRLRNHPGFRANGAPGNTNANFASNTSANNSAAGSRHTLTRHGSISSRAFSISNAPLTPRPGSPVNLVLDSASGPASVSISASASTSALPSSFPSPRSKGKARRYSHPPELSVTAVTLPTPKSQPPKTKLNQSTFSSSLENGNNKKRKIPIMAEPPVFSNNSSIAVSIPTGTRAAPSATGSLSRGETYDSTDPSMSSPGPRDRPGFSHSLNYVSTPSPNSVMTTPTSTKGGISGPGRGMFGRPRNPRTPLRAAANPSPHAWPDHRTTGIGPVPASAMGGPSSSERMRSAPAWTTTDTHPGGIISNAIAMAEKMSVTTGNDNVSLLAQHTESKTTPTETQFTFVCDSPDAGTVKWPGPGMQEVVVPYDPHYMPSPTEQYSQPVEERRISTRTAPPLAEKVKEPAPMTMEQQRQEKRKNRRVLEKELAEQARERRFQTRRRLSKNPPPAPLLDEEEYICLFCDYEAIFGEPPRYLIRSFELRARNERIEEEKKRRRLEQVKARNRKGKKATAGKTPMSKGSTAGST